MDNIYLVGKNISHSLSPIIHNKAFKDFGINKSYHLYEANNEIKANYVLKENSFVGANITTPYKETFFKKGIVISKKSIISNSINTLYMKDGLIHATTTDGIGFCRSLNMHNKKICIFGFGATARSIILELANKNFEINVVMRNPDFTKKWTKLLNVVKMNIYDIKEIQKIKNMLSNCDILLDATGISRFNKSILSSDFICENQICIDLNYGINFKSKFLENAVQKKAIVKDGLDMLVYQAQESFYKWTQKKFDVDEMMDFLKGEYVKY